MSEAARKAICVYKQNSVFGVYWLWKANKHKPHSQKHTTWFKVYYLLYKHVPQHPHKKPGTEQCVYDPSTQKGHLELSVSLAEFMNSQVERDPGCTREEALSKCVLLT